MTGNDPRRDPVTIAAVIAIDYHDELEAAIANLRQLSARADARATADLAPYRPHVSPSAYAAAHALLMCRPQPQGPRP